MESAGHRCRDSCCDAGHALCSPHGKPFFWPYGFVQKLEVKVERNSAVEEP